MKDVSLRELLEAGCHFGHKADRWHPKASEFIYQTREGLHIIDLAKTREGLRKAAQTVYDLGKEGKNLLFIATKRQAKGVVSEAARSAHAPFMVNRWVGGFFTNWEAVKKNIDKINRMRKERTDGDWQKFPKHEIVKLEKDLRKLEMVYGGVADLQAIPEAIFMVDIKKEIIALTEARRRKLEIVAIVDTNSNPQHVSHAIPANDDAVGSISFITKFIAEAYFEGKTIFEKKQESDRVKEAAKTTEKPEENEKEEKNEKKEVKVEKKEEKKQEKEEKKEKTSKKKA